MKTQPFIITLTGASASGKSYVIDKIIEVSKEFLVENIPFVPVPFPKYTTREYRANEIAKKQQGEFVDVISVDEVPNDCDLVYGTYGKEYGLRTKDLAEKLKNDKCPMVVINDVRAVEELKKVFEGRVLSLFLFRHVPNFEEFKEETNKRGNVSDKELLERYVKATALYRIYIENITVFDRVILNVKDESEDEHKCTKLQIQNIIRGIFNNKISLNKNQQKGAKLFIISGNNASGKDDVNRAIQKMGKLQAEVISKYTSRRQEKDDEKEMICQFTPKTDLVESYKADYNERYNRISEYYSQSIPQSFINDCKTKYDESKNELFEDFCNVQWDIQRLKKLREMQKPMRKFWEEQNDNSDFFQKNNNYINLNDLLKKSQQYNPKGNDELCYLVKHNNIEYIIYKNHGQEVIYGFSIDSLSQNLQDRKHRVLVASFVNIFEYCKGKIGQDNVVPIFSYSQISKKDYDKQAKSAIEKLKSRSYDDLKRYSENIVDFDHVIIYAETQMQNESGGQKEELIDQIFRLFRVYNKEQIDNKNTLFVLSGPSATGKSTILSKIAEERLCKVAPKYADRERRSTEFDDITPVTKECIYEFCNEIHYEMYGNLYGFNIDRIKKELNKNNLITICSDFNSIKKMKDSFNENFSAIFIYLQDISVENLLKAYIEREKLRINDKELFLLASKLSESLKTENKSEFEKLEKIFQIKMKKHLTNADFKEFNERYKSLIYCREDYVKNECLFNHAVSGENLDEILKKCRNIIKKQEYV